MRKRDISRKKAKGTHGESETHERHGRKKAVEDGDGDGADEHVTHKKHDKEKNKVKHDDEMDDDNKRHASSKRLDKLKTNKKQRDDVHEEKHVKKTATSTSSPQARAITTHIDTAISMSQHDDQYMDTFYDPIHIQTYKWQTYIHPFTSLIDIYPSISWMTLMDTQFGQQAVYLMKHGVPNVIATDLSNDTLIHAIQRHHIISSRIISTSSHRIRLPFIDDEVGFILCHDTLSIWENPMHMIDEMARVVTHGIIIIERMIHGKQKQQYGSKGQQKEDHT